MWEKIVNYILYYSGLCYHPSPTCIIKKEQAVFHPPPTFLAISWALFCFQPVPLLYNHTLNPSFHSLPSAFLQARRVWTSLHLPAHCAEAFTALSPAHSLLANVSDSFPWEINQEICKFIPNLSKPCHPVQSSPNKILLVSGRQYPGFINNFSHQP